MRLSKKPSVQEQIRKARCSAVMVRLTAPADANGPKISRRAWIARRDA